VSLAIDHDDFGLVEPFRKPSAGRPIGLDTALLFALVLSAHLCVAAAVAFYATFPSTYDEIAHISFIKALADTPVWFPHYGDYRLLDPTNLTLWTSEPNYIAHPSLYYLFMAPIWTLSGGSVIALRLTDVALSGFGLALTAAAGLKLIEERRAQLLFILLVFCFPKNPIIGGIASNDNFVLIASGLFFWGCANPHHRTLWICLALMLAGWTKLTALIGLTTAAGCLSLYTMQRNHRLLLRREHVLLAGACLLGALPYGVNWMRTGHLLYVPQNSFWIIPEDQRLHLDLFGFMRVFIEQIVNKFPAGDRMMDDGLPLAILIMLSFFAFRKTGEEKARRVAISFLAAFVIFVPIHFYYAWQTFLSSGETCDAQPRYYNELWPGLALALALASTSIDRGKWPIATICVVILSLLPTAAGLIIYSPAA
jgi:hypothetical protein